MTGSSDSLNANIPYHFQFISTEVDPAYVHTWRIRDLEKYGSGRDQTEWAVAIIWKALHVVDSF